MALNEHPGAGAGQDGGLADWVRRHPNLSVAAFYLALIVIVRGPSFSITVIDADESAFWLAAREVVRGHLPYTTFFDIKPVGSTLLLAAALKLFGGGLFAIRLLGALCVWATSFLLYRLGLRLAAAPAVAITGGLLYVGFAATMHGQATMTEILLAPFTTAGVLLLLAAVRRPRLAEGLGLMVLSGLAFGMSVLIKLIPAAPAAAAVGAVLLHQWLGGELKFRTAFVLGLGALAGVLTPFLLSAVLYLAVHQWPAFYTSNFAFAGAYVKSSDSAARLMSALLRLAAGVWPLLLFAAVALIAGLRTALAQRRLSLGLALLAAWLVGEVFASSATLHFYPHYFLMTLPPLCLLCAEGIGRSVTWIGTRNAAQAAIGLGLILLLVPVVPLLALQGPTMLSRFDIWRTAAAEIRKDAGGRKPTLFVLTQGMLALYPLTGADLPTPRAQPAQLLSDDRTMTEASNRDEYRRILATGPDFIVLDEVEDPPQWVLDGLRSAVACCYRRVATVRDFLNLDMAINRRHDVDIYQRTGPVAASPVSAAP